MPWEYFTHTLSDNYSTRRYSTQRFIYCRMIIALRSAEPKPTCCRLYYQKQTPMFNENAIPSHEHPQKARPQTWISHFGLRSVDYVCIKDRPRDLSYSILMKRDPRRAYVTTRSTMAINDKCLIRSFSSAIFHLDFPLETILLHVTRHISIVFPIACQLISQIRLYDITSTARGLMTADVAKMNMQSLIPQNRLPG